MIHDSLHFILNLQKNCAEMAQNIYIFSVVPLSIKMFNNLRM